MPNRLKYILALCLIVLFISAGCAAEPPPPDKYQIDVNGALQRSFSGHRAYIHEINSGHRLVLQKWGPGEGEVRELDVYLPETIQEGEYLIESGTPVWAEYNEITSENENYFMDHSSGTIVFHYDEDKLFGTIDFTVQRQGGTDSVHILADFWDVSLP